MKFTSTAIRRPVATLSLMLLAAVLGVIGYLRLPVDFLPEVTYPMVRVHVYWPGATPGEIVDNIAEPIEQVLATVDNLDYLESSSIEGQYTLRVNFEYGTDIDVAYQDVVAKMGLATRRLPPDVDPPVMFKADPSQLPIAQLIVMSDSRDLISLRTWVENILQDQFLAIRGVAGTEVLGGLRREIRVYLNPDRISAYNLSLTGVINRLKDENIERMAGRVTEGQREFILRTTAEFKDIDEIRDLVVSAPGQMQVKLSDLATVEDTHEDQRVLTRFNSNPAIKLNILKQADANTVEVADDVDRLIDQLAESAPSDIRFDVVENQAVYIRSSISGVTNAAIGAVILVILVVFLFLGHWRQVLVMLIALPLTILFNFFIMQVSGFSLNIFSLGGLVVAMGVVLDNSIVVIENITRRTHKLQRPSGVNADLGTSTFSDLEEVTSSATSQVALAVLAATLTFLALFLPFLLVSGLTTLLFRELILTIAGIVLISLVVSLTVTPALAHYLVVKPGKGKQKDNFFDRVILALNRTYKRLLTLLLRLRWVVFLVFLVAMGITVHFARQLGSEFLPSVDDGRIMIKTFQPTGTALAKTDSLLAQLESVVKDDPYVDRYFTLSGGRVWGLITYEVADEGQIDIELVPRSQRPYTTREYVELLRPKVMQFSQPGVRLVVAQQRMRGIRRTGDSEVEVKVRGQDIDRLGELSQQVLQAMNGIEGLTNIRVGTQINKPEYQIHIRRDRLADLGISAQNVATTARSLVDGSVATHIREAGELYNVRVMLPENRVRNRQDIENFYVDAPGGTKVPLRYLASIEYHLGPVEVIRENQVMQIVVSSDVAQGANIGRVARNLEGILEEFPLPEGYSFDLGGQVYLMQESQGTMTEIILFALFFAFIILSIQFNSFRQPFLILLGVPFAFVGVVAALLLTGFPAGATVLIGIVIMIGGIATQGVVLISFVNEYRDRGMGVREAILEGAPLRLRPIIMTQVTTVLGLLPLALNIGEGGDMLQPMAIAVIGGLLFSLFVTLFLLPCLYYIFEKKRSI
jgi:hydrophobic/amphiphilic exporter-1 (mainly G- bacteria), HAE1 family